MNSLEEALNKLPKKSPDRGFINMSKKRIMHQIELQSNETWFFALLKKLNYAIPSNAFIKNARIRIIENIHFTKQPVWAWLKLLKRATASILIMMIAVVATLFFVEGRTTVNAHEDTYIEVISGNVTLKHADNLMWDNINIRTNISEGDLIKLDENASAIIHFFDDTELRLADNALMLISKIDISPAYARQGIIETSLHQGMAWIQVLNADDEHAQFSIVTRDAVIKTVNASFDVSTGLQKHTSIRVFNSKVKVNSLRADTRSIFNTFTLKNKTKASVMSTFNSADNPIITEGILTEQDMANEWVQNNLKSDYLHLTSLRTNELNNLSILAGALPGEMLYPVKQAKERLKLIFSENTDTQIEIANKRLNEAIVLLEKGEQKKAAEAISAYKTITERIARIAKEKNETKQVARKLLTPPQKALIASLPNDIKIIKEALNETEELLTDTQADKEKVRLKNSVENLQNTALLIKMGNFTAAKEALRKHHSLVKTILDDADKMENTAEKKEALTSVLELKNEELELLQAIVADLNGQKMKDAQLSAILDVAQKESEKEVELMLTAIAPFVPIQIPDFAQRSAFDKQISEFVDKVNIYRTWQGQKNQISRLLKTHPTQANNIIFLAELSKLLDSRAGDLINSKILNIESKAKINKHKAVKRKIDRAKRLRTN